MTDKSTTINRIMIFLSVLIFIFELNLVINNSFNSYFDAVFFVQDYEGIFRMITSVLFILFLSVFKNSEKKNVIPAIVFFIWGFEWIIFKNLLERAIVNRTTNWWGLDSNFGFPMFSLINSLLCLTFGAFSIVSAIGILKKWKTKAFIIVSLCLGVLSTRPLSLFSSFSLEVLFSLLYFALFAFILFFKNENSPSESENSSYDTQSQTDEEKAV